MWHYVNLCGCYVNKCLVVAYFWNFPFLTLPELATLSVFMSSFKKKIIDGYASDLGKWIVNDISRFCEKSLVCRLRCWGSRSEDLCLLPWKSSRNEFISFGSGQKKTEISFRSVPFVIVRLVFHLLVGFVFRWLGCRLWLVRCTVLHTLLGFECLQNRFRYCLFVVLSGIWFGLFSVLL